MKKYLVAVKELFTILIQPLFTFEFMSIIIPRSLYLMTDTCPSI